MRVKEFDGKKGIIMTNTEKKKPTFSDAALMEEHFSLIQNKAARALQGDFLGDLSWGCVVEALQSPIWLDACLGLHERVFLAGEQAGRQGLVKRDEDYFLNLLTGKEGVLFGAFVGVQLIGMVALRRHEGLGEALAKKTLTCPFGERGAEAPSFADSVQVIQSLCVDPVFTKQRVGCFLLEAALAEAGRLKNSTLFAQVAAHNKQSWLKFLSHGFGIVWQWKTNYSRFLLQRFTQEEKTARSLARGFVNASLAFCGPADGDDGLRKRIKDALPNRLYVFGENDPKTKKVERLILS